MGSGPRIAIDAMGGDVGPEVMLAGAARAWRRRQDLSFILFGDEPAIEAELAKHDALRPVCEIVHAPDIIAPDLALLFVGCRPATANNRLLYLAPTA